MAFNDDSLNGNAFNCGTNSEVALKNCSRLVILGAPQVGKTCIINWFLSKGFRDSYIPTIEDFHRKIYKIRGEIYRLDILDTSGNDPFPAMKKLNIMTSDLFVLVFSIDDIDSYVQVKQLCELIRELKKSKQDSRHNNNSSNIPILILGNKLDYLLENKITNRCVNLVDAQQFASSFKSCIYCEVSCKNLIGLDGAFEKLFTQANLPVEMVPSKHRRVSLNLDLTKPQFSKQIIHGQNSNSSTNSDANQTNNANNNSKQSIYTKQKEDSKMNSLSLAKPNETTGNGGSAVLGGGGGGGTMSGTNNNSSSNTLTVEREGSFKIQAKKSFRKMTFRRQLTEACGAVWLNARRPSIRAELKLLQVKTNGNLIYHQTVENRHNNNHNNNNSNTNRQTSFPGLQFFIQSFRKLFCCHTNSNGNSRTNYLNNKNTKNRLL